MTKRYLAVGINDYSGLDGTGKSNLSSCIADANSMADLLVSSFGFSADGSQTLTDQQANSAGIQDALRTLLASSIPGDVVCFYYSGHGARIPSVDTQADCDKFYESIVPASGAFLSDRDLFALGNALDPSTINFTVILDSCHSGGMDQETDGSFKCKSPVMAADLAQRIEDFLKTLIPSGILIPPGSDACACNVTCVPTAVVGHPSITEDPDKILIDQAKTTLIAGQISKFRSKNSATHLTWRAMTPIFCLAASLLTASCDKNKQTSPPTPPSSIVETPTLTIYQAAAKGDLHQLQLSTSALAALGVRLDALDQNGCTALYYAAMQGQVEAARFLIEHGANMNIRQTGMKFTAAHVAAQYNLTNLPAMLQLLHDKGADLNIGDVNGDTVLHIVAQYRRVDAVKVLLASGVAVTATNNNGQTPWDMVRLLDKIAHTVGGTADIIASKAGPMRCSFNTVPSGINVRIGMQLNNNSPSGFIDNNSGRIVGKTPCTVVLQESDVEKQRGGIYVLFETTLADPYMSIASLIKLAPPDGRVLEPGELYKLTYTLQRRVH